MDRIHGGMLSNSEPSDNEGLKQPFIKLYLPLLFPLFFYLALLFPENTGFSSIDSWGFPSAAETLGITHPPGYVLYLWCMKLFLCIAPILQISREMAPVFFSFGIGALCIITFYHTLITRKIKPEIAAALAILLLQSNVFQFSSINIEVYNFQMLLFLLFFHFCYKENRLSRIGTGIFIAGLLFSHHTTSITAIGIILIPLIWKRPKSILPLCPLFFIGPVLHMLHLFIRSQTEGVLNFWTEMNSFSKVWYHFSAKVFYYMVKLPDAVMIKRNLMAIGELFPAWGFLLLLILLIASWKKNSFANHGQILVLFLISSCQNFIYAIPDIETYYTLPLCSLLLLMGLSLKQLPISSRLPNIFLIATGLCTIFIPNVADVGDESSIMGREIIENAQVIQAGDSSAPLFLGHYAHLPMVYGKYYSKQLEHIELLYGGSFFHKDYYESAMKRLQKDGYIREYPKIPGLSHNLEEKAARDSALWRINYFLHHTRFETPVYISSIMETFKPVESLILKYPYINYGVWNLFTKKGAINNPVYSVSFVGSASPSEFHQTRYFKKDEKISALVFLRNLERKENLTVVLKGKTSLKTPLPANIKGTWKVDLPTDHWKDGQITMLIYNVQGELLSECKLLLSQ
jgi:hypothetical protein